MNIRVAQNGYGTAQRNVGTPRAVEIDVLAQITRTLRAAEAARETEYVAFVDALQANAELWRIFAQDLSDTGNGLPLELRRGLFALAGFVHDETNRILLNGTTSEELCAINHDILTGLRQSNPVEAGL